MKLLSSLLVLVSLGIFTPNLFADPLITVNAGVGDGLLVETPILGGEQWVYTDAVAQLNILPPGLQVADQTFTATFTDIAGIPLLNITDICADVDVGLPPLGCPGLAFSFTNLGGLGTPEILSALGDIGVNLNGDVVGINVDASIGGGSAQIGFSNPPPPPPPAATPEPGSLTLLGTSLLGAAGMLRRRLKIARGTV